MNAMRRAALVATALVSTTLSAQVAKDYRDIKAPALRKVNMPQPKRLQLDNGMVIFLMEDHELPLIRGGANIRGGARDEPADKVGLVGILGSAWRTGGTEKQSGDQLDELLESRAASIETGGDDDSLAIRFDVLKNDFDAVFPIFVDLLRNPAFRQEKIDLAKTQASAGISRRNDEPDEILGREAAKLGYGPTSVYARQAEYATIGAITRDDLLAFHKRFVHPNNILFGVVGDFDSAQMESTLRQAFASWPRGPQAAKTVPEPAPAQPGIYFVSKPDVTQANIAVVHRGIQRNNPDYYAVAVMNEILGGGFSGRLINKLRTQRGLTYDVGGGLGAPWDHPGLFEVTMATKSGTTLEAIDALRGELKLLHTSPFTAEELTLAKESILNAFIFTLDSRRKVLEQAMVLEFYGFPPDYFQKYPQMIERVTAEDVARVAKKYVTPDQLAVLVVGNEKDFEKSLSTLGTVTPLDITIPEPGGGGDGGSKNTKPAAGNAEGAALIAKITQFAGGKAKLDALQSVHRVQNASGPQGDAEIDSTTVYPDRVRVVMKTAMGEVTRVITPDAAFASLPGSGVRDLPESQRASVRSDARQDILAILKYQDKYTFAAAGTEKVGNVEARVLDVTSEGDTVRFLVDPASGRILRKIAHARGPQGDAEIVTDYSDWKSYGGIMLPASSAITANGESVAKVQLKSAEINAPVDPKIFMRPQ